MADMASLQVIVYGRVQGVFFRDFVARWAKKLGLTGCVSNLAGGAVEVKVEGEKGKLEELFSYLEVGPPAARVEKVVANWEEYAGDYTDFKVRY